MDNNDPCVVADFATKKLYIKFQRYQLEDLVKVIEENKDVPAIGLDAEIVPAPIGTRNMGGEFYGDWKVPNEYKVGWLPTSGIPGAGGNIVLGGHHNVYGRVFGRLIELEEGDIISIQVGEILYLYQVDQTMLLAERDQPIDVRLSNAQWIKQSVEEKLTLVTCWPDWSNTHRVIIVAFPINE